MDQNNNHLDNNDSPATVLGKIIVATVVTFVIVGIIMYTGII